MDTARGTTRNRWIDPERLALAINAASSDEDGAIFILLARTGYRVDDLIGAKLSDIDAGKIELTEQKTGKRRAIKLDEFGKNLIRNLIRYTANRRGESEWLVPARKKGSGHISRTTIWRAWRRAIRAAGLTGRGYTIHSLRKAYAVELFKRTGSLEAVRHDLNHERISTTLIYLQDYFSSLARISG